MNAALGVEYTHAEDAYQTLVESARIVKEAAFATDDSVTSEKYGALYTDIAKAAKIARLSKAAAKAEYRKDHPLPDPYSELSAEEISEPRSEPASVPEGEASTDPSEPEPMRATSKAAIIIALALAALCIPCAVLYYRRKKK